MRGYVQLLSQCFPQAVKYAMHAGELTLGTK
jgi:hypothetical protein